MRLARVVGDWRTMSQAQGDSLMIETTTDLDVCQRVDGESALRRGQCYFLAVVGTTVAAAVDRHCTVAGLAAVMIDWVMLDHLNRRVRGQPTWTKHSSEAVHQVFGLVERAMGIVLLVVAAAAVGIVEVAAVAWVVVAEWVFLVCQWLRQVYQVFAAAAAVVIVVVAAAGPAAAVSALDS